MSGLRWGIMGTGGIAATMAAALRAAGSPVAAVGSAHRGLAEAFAAEGDIAAVCSSHEAVALRDDVDVVYVATTNDRHRRNVLDCIEHGKPALCEKPIALNVDQAHEMCNAARSAGVFLMEAMWMRFQPFMAKLDELIAEGAVGRVTHVRAMLSFQLELDPLRRWANPELGGGSLLDLGVYPLSFVHHVLGPPDHFEALTRLGPTGVDLETSVVSEHRDGATAVATSSFVSDGPNDATVSGTEGRIRLQARFHQSRMLTLERGDKTVESFDVDYEGHGFQFEIAEVERCLEEGLAESPLRPHADTLAVMEWMDAIRAHCGIVFPQDRV